jgi:beta-glucosidase-like glycosyl hydrolase
MKQYLIFAIIFITNHLHAIITIDQLTLDQKIGQLFMVAAVADEEVAKDFLHQKTYRMDKEYIEQLITQYHIGGIIYLGKSDYHKQKERTQHFQNISHIPLLIGQDLEPGRVGISRLNEMQKFSNNQTLGNKNNKDETYQTALEIGKLCKELGVHINFAPVADVNNNPDNPVINNRSFGDNPELVTTHALAFAQGLHDAGIIACAKHFPGHGDTNVDSHEDLPLIKHDRKRLDIVELYPFKQLIHANIPVIMIAHLEVPVLEEQPKTPSTVSKKIVTHLLRDELNFKGLIITDGLDMQGITDHYFNGQAELQALLAGNDILLSPVDVPAAVTIIKQAVADNIITEQDIDAHVKKILSVKNKLKF